MESASIAKLFRTAGRVWV